MAVERQRTAIGFLLLLGVLAVAIVALFFPRYDDTLLAQSIVDLTNALDATNINVNLLNSQIVEINMNQAVNVTLLLNGTFIWGLSRGETYAPPFVTCSGTTVAGFTIVSPGSGYRAGDLVTVNLDNVTQDYVWYEHPVLRVDTVDEGGAVLTLTALTTGCLNFDNNGNSNMDTLSVVGTGLVVTTVSPTDTVPSAFSGYYDFSTPPTDLCAPLQMGRYELYQMTIGLAAFTVLDIYPPEFPFPLHQYGSTARGSDVSSVQIFMFNFSAFPTELDSLGTQQYIFPMTQRNLNDITLTDDGNCLTTGACAVNVNFFTPDTLRAFKFDTEFTSPAIRYQSWLMTRITVTTEYGLESSNGVFTLNNPWMLVIPSL